MKKPRRRGRETPENIGTELWTKEQDIWKPLPMKTCGISYRLGLDEEKSLDIKDEVERPWNTKRRLPSSPPTSYSLGMEEEKSFDVKGEVERPWDAKRGLYGEKYFHVKPDLRSPPQTPVPARYQTQRDVQLASSRRFSRGGGGNYSVGLEEKRSFDVKGEVEKPWNAGGLYEDRSFYAKPDRQAPPQTQVPAPFQTQSSVQSAGSHSKLKGTSTQLRTKASPSPLFLSLPEPPRGLKASYSHGSNEERPFDIKDEVERSWNAERGLYKDRSFHTIPDRQAPPQILVPARYQTQRGISSTGSQTKARRISNQLRTKASPFPSSSLIDKPLWSPKQL